ncbi:hypothetical protein PHLGIDRAFT_26486 [Phlebiopsis gigantea 11061_1 CR5-6]|uniref:Uncharacterized protein n=1 Tax=Phlebiopsis gigantea (strain 11061_1 CR5-6) TaxID=745531 RepID=A0A0C3S0S2_PHLG1|nr:hypothetical protein PHLGIDRAFT_26486 [Phlebiopsis gigantea 11061_1 CR5-6]
MDIRHDHGADVHVVRANHDDAADLVAIGGAHSVQVLLTTSTSARVIANFYLGCRVTALAWSSRCTSPSTTDEWSIELAAAGAHFGLFQLTKAHDAEEEIFAFGGGLSGHHGKINDMAFCGGQSEDGWRYVATVSDDKMLLVWDLNPAFHVASPGSPSSSDAPPRAPPTAYVISFPHPLTSVCAHPSTGKEFLVADARGSIFLTDWRSDPDENGAASWRNSSVVELVEPRALADAAAGAAGRWAGSVAWRRDSPDIIGAAYGARFSLWDLSKLQGGKPNATGPTFPDGGTKFRWCSSYPDYFAVTTNSPGKGAVVHVHNTGYLQAQPTVFSVAPRPAYVRDFDFLAAKGIPRIAAAVGRELVVFYIGVES